MTASSAPAPEPKLRLGGMALRNGLLVHGPTHWAASIRDENGQIAVASGPKPRLRGADRIPGVRGLARLAEAFAVLPLVKRALPTARMPFEDAAVLGTMGAAALAGALIRRRGAGRVVPEAAAAALGATGPAVGVFVWCERHADTATARAIRRPGYELQRAVGTREPTPEQLQVGRAALDEILRLEGAAGPAAALAKSNAGGDSLEPRASHR